jgi:ATP-dependent protease ClpP protease subunit
VNTRRRREILAALEPATLVALERSKPRAPKDVPGLSVRNEGGTRELMIYGRIGGGGWFSEGISAADVAAALRELGAGHVDVRINSGGGDVFDGVAIHSLLARHTGGTTVYIDGLAASAASFIAMAGDRIVMARNAFFMIHDGMTGTYGNPKTHRRSADLLDKVSDNIADMYAERAGEDPEYWRNLMSENDEDGTWYTGQEALEAGLVDEITGAEDEETEARSHRLLAGWSNMLPEQIRATLTSEQEQPEEQQPAPEEQPAAPDEEQPEEQEQPDAPAEEEVAEADFAHAMSMIHFLNTTAVPTARKDAA